MTTTAHAPALAGLHDGRVPEVVRPVRPEPSVPVERTSRRRGRCTPGTPLTVGSDLLLALAASAATLHVQDAVVPTAVAHLLLALAWVGLLGAGRCYAAGPISRHTDVLAQVCRAVITLVALVALLPGLLPGVVPQAEDPRHLLLTTMLLLAGSLGARLVPQAVRRLGHRRATGRPTVVVGHGRQVTRIVEELRGDPGVDLDVTAVCVPATSRRQFDVPCARGFDRLAAVVAARAAEVVVVLPCEHFDAAALRRIGWQLEATGAQLVVASGLVDVHRSRAEHWRTRSLHLTHVRPAQLTGARRLLKQAWERPAAALGLLLLAPLLGALALAIRLDSPGPAFFRQTRIGKDGRPFVMLKLRTMTADAESRVEELTGDRPGSDVMFKMSSDPRVTHLGRWLRRYSLDELPQLVNVVRGEMSLVGPRPPLHSEVLAYDRDVLRRLVVRPGLTGLWQVSGRSDLPWEETVRLDLGYVDNWSLGLDAQIMLKTLRAVVGHRGAY
ncbi:exopolysaccharide biosynthesis polyprenyl glycosylphosphotransferase [Nocardioides sp.]|uniref:exopolysaccharide biosynthesis polyprenyl glycosylphosphotransferase n=1 Tax=Nocardioides sp. TaxID=35761 RepID=UPI002B26E58E|nr:exopolysaccharide biosynthesis polyprenyl glycosylphosphotransferase [Nocardioides sp.]